jgi:PKD repeat protein
LSGPAPLAVTFTDASTGKGQLTWAWDFGDGNTSVEQSPVHTYSNAGTFSVALTVTSTNGASTTTSRTGYITVSPAPVAPVADFTASPLSGTAPHTVTFTDASSGTDLLTWTWDFGDGSAENATLQNPVHTYADIGLYTVSLEVTNAIGSNSTIKTGYINVTQAPVAPVADFTGSPESGTAPLAVTFTDASAGTDILSWAWNFGDASAENATLQNPVHTFENIGTNTVSLMVS